MKYQFNDYAHDDYVSSETVEALVSQGWNAQHAQDYVAENCPMCEVKGEFEYDTETGELTVLAAVINGVRLTP